MRLPALIFVCALPMLAVSAAQANDFPTQARVEYVLQCMDKSGGQSYDTLYPCICSIDKIAGKMPYDTYEKAATLDVMVKTAGEKGGAFRDAPGARKLVKLLRTTREESERSCFVKRVEANAG